MDLEKRIRMAAESILENEALREGLHDDEAASVLLDWGIACAKQIASGTAYLEDETEAEEAAYPRMRALRQLLGDVVELCAENLEPSRQIELLREIIDQIPIVYGPTPMPFEASKLTTFLAEGPATPAQIINGFRTLIEKTPNTE